MKKQSSLSKDAQAYHLIKEALFDRKLSPGLKIIYRDLEEMFGMSKTPIINALVRMEQEGLVVSHRNRGFYVRELKAREIVQMYDLGRDWKRSPSIMGSTMGTKRIWFT